MFGVVLVISLSLGELYRIGQQFVGWKTWQIALLIHALLVLLGWFRGLLVLDYRSRLKPQVMTWIRRTSLFLCLLWLGLSFSRLWGQPPPFQSLPSIWLVLGLGMAVPVIEECFFRRLIGDFVKSRFGGDWGSYLSLCIFTFVHSLPAWRDLPMLSLELSLGVLLLGIACEFLLVKSRSLIPPILLHSGMNLTSLLLASYDPRWLHWLAPMFLNG